MSSNITALFFSVILKNELLGCEGSQKLLPHTVFVPSLPAASFQHMCFCKHAKMNEFGHLSLR